MIYEFWAKDEKGAPVTIVVDFGAFIPAKPGVTVTGRVVEVRREVIER